jgi:pimeloyl-ACP methyl ester carboxylesterase
MTKVFVHGTPETDAIWGPLFGVLAERGVTDVATLSPPGFGAPTPDGWDPTPANYVDWLSGELGALDGPVDLVGHDWGAGHVLGLVATEGAALRSWAVDCCGLAHEDYVWHDMAQAWQTPEIGEAVVEAMTSPPLTERVESYVGLGLPAPIAESCATATDAEMGRCILGLYRGGAQPAMAEMGRRLLSSDRTPGLTIDATGDPFVASELGREMADRLGNQLLTLADRGHWWMVEDPAEAADGLIAFWGTIER